MKEIINVTGIHTVDYLKDYTAGKFRFITKTRAGFYTVSDARDFDNPRYMANPEGLLRAYKKGALQTVEFCPEGGDYYLTVFARVGKKIKLVDKAILANLTVGTINSMWYNTELYSQQQYNAVNSKTWASMAYVMNEPESQPVAA
jgi:hypothetical protein